MIEARHVLYEGTQHTQTKPWFYREGDFFLLLEQEEEGDGQKLLTFAKHVLSHKIDSLTSFESAVGEAVKLSDISPAVGIAAGILIDEILYLATNGSGKVVLQRGGKTAELVSEGRSASGYVEDKDILLFTVASGEQEEVEEALMKVLKKRQLTGVIEDLQDAFGGSPAAPALFVQFEFKQEDVSQISDVRSQMVEDITPSESEIRDQRSDIKSTSIFTSLREKIQSLRPQEGVEPVSKQSNITKAVVVVIAVVLLWSVVLGYQRRRDAETDKKIQVAREIITQKLDQSEEVAFLNASRSQELIDEARAELSSLEHEVGEKRKKEVDELRALIQSREGQVTKREEKQVTEFYDLTVENKKAVASLLSASGSTLAILDTTNATTYLLDVEKKSLTKLPSAQARSAQIVGVDEGESYLLAGDVYKLTESGAKKVIEKDTEWGSPRAIAFYNGNLYLLDAGKQDIYKYVPVEGGYSAKSSYFKGSTPDLSSAHSLAIDSSLYIGLADSIVKFTGGLQDSFSTEFPDSDVRLARIFTDKETEKVYAWDKDKGVLYVLGKNGSYERQIKADMLSKATDVAVTGDKAYLGAHEKIYVIDLK